MPAWILRSIHSAPGGAKRIGSWLASARRAASPPPARAGVALSLVRMLWTWFLTVGRPISQAARRSPCWRAPARSARRSRARARSAARGRAGPRRARPPCASSSAASFGEHTVPPCAVVSTALATSSTSTPALEQPADAGLGPRDHRRLVGLGHVEGHDPRGRERGREQPRRLQAHGRRDVEQHGIRSWLELVEVTERVRHVRGSPDHVKPRVTSQQPFETFPVEPDLGDDEHARHLSSVDGIARSGAFNQVTTPSEEPCPNTANVVYSRSTNA